ncbi:hypothetical protein BU23DRAFT_600124 [Bimuria novae-zelandiae CBS 107.79]|uniref:Uncharacterized protein n=1 Tax=Bimuria novae-zelandiae CBS 107.79 TaxID=1447943 RepID=A0A6A5V2T9_9PLEO|nr:hypothetical protein BU23DRAFT_600124 [Bimuria novae-zelandiae CBS 107.79]
MNRAEDEVSFQAVRGTGPVLSTRFGVEDREGRHYELRTNDGTRRRRQRGRHGSGEGLGVPESTQYCPGALCACDDAMHTFKSNFRDVLGICYDFQTVDRQVLEGDFRNWDDAKRAFLLFNRHVFEARRPRASFTVTTPRCADNGRKPASIVQLTHRRYLQIACGIRADCHLSPDSQFGHHPHSEREGATNRAPLPKTRGRSDDSNPQE